MPLNNCQRGETKEQAQKVKKADLPIAVRAVDLTRPVSDLEDVAGYGSTKISVNLGSRLIGVVDIDNNHKPIGAKELLDAVSRNLDSRLLAYPADFDDDTVAAEVQSAFRRRYAANGKGRVSPALAADRFISVVVPTYDRPEQLRGCLRCLVSQEFEGRYEIIVVDNHSSSDLTKPVVKEFPGVRLLSVERAGAAAARNAGFRASQGGIIAMTDDDVLVPPGWLRNLSRSFARSDVAAVFGRILPSELETRAQRSFEQYGSLSSSPDPLEVGPSWFSNSGFRPPPVWTLGATANAAIRRDVLEDPLIGFMDEALGPGTPSGAGEDPYMIYRILKEGRTIIYDPEVYVLHQHRRSMPELRRQIYNYGKSLYAFGLTTVIRDRDFRAIPFLLFTVPWIQLRRLLRSHKYPKSLVVAEILGNLAGPLGLLRARLRLRRQILQSRQKPEASAYLEKD